VAAAVVPILGSDPDERELQDFVALQLAPFKVPRRILVVDEIPKGPTGKVQRIGMAERLERVLPWPGRTTTIRGASSWMTWSRSGGRCS
jgi:acyl-coenzyme A synthetase/AMP-(fatty) acid ligase